jgi:hypothetical protein
MLSDTGGDTARTGACPVSPWKVGQARGADVFKDQAYAA